MSYFASGVSGYIHTAAEITVHFPIDERGSASVNCVNCYLYREASRRCGITGEIIPYPNKYVGNDCPLIPIEKGEKHDS